MKTQGWGARGVGMIGTVAACFVACAGGDVPGVDGDLRDTLADSYGGAASVGGSAGSAGAAGAAGAGGGAALGSPDGSLSPGGAAGAGGGAPLGASPGGGDPLVCDAYTTVFAQKCNGGNCHGSGALNGDFAASPEAAAALVDVVSTRGDRCGVYIDPLNSDDSLLLTMVNGESDPSACFPVLMPLGADDLPADEIDCITEWLTQFEQ